MMRRLIATLGAVLAATAFVALPRPSASAGAEVVDPSLLQALHWRSIGPYRGGRSLGVSGVVGSGRIFYFGAVGGGVWKTENAGRTWAPIMDGEHVASIGAIAVAPSDPATVYVGSGEADMRSDIIAGNGMYRSTDAGATWRHVGLDVTQQIGRILVDPHDSRTLLVAALGHAYTANDARGVYRSTDGGATWTRTLFRNANVGAIDLAATPDGTTVYASLWQTRRPPWATYPPSNGPGGGLFVSHDGGVTWQPIAGHGFPSAGLGKVGLAVAPSDPDRVYAIVDAKAGGLYRSDDAGVTWRRFDADPRLWERGWYFCHVVVDPHDADRVYVSDTSVYRSNDGGATFTAIKGSPDGDDFHQLWIDPTDGSHLVLASDQGTTVSVDGAQTWSSWFNQPTGQFYHVATDDTFPYHLYGAQQDSGAARIVSRSDHRGIEARDWQPITAGGESGAIAPDPGDASVIFGGVVAREDLRSQRTQDVSPTVGRPGPWRATWTLPLAFGPDRALYFSHQMVFRTRDGGTHWEAISGDLTRRHPGTPASLDPATAADASTAEPRGVVYSLAPSPRDRKTVWAGTDDGLVRLTRDGGRTWRDVTPPGVTAWSKISGIDASPLDARTAYVAVDRHQLGDDRPYVDVTHDAGRTWRAGVVGIPDESFVNAIRADPVRRGLLYAATETAVYVSFDDGHRWQSLQLGMPTTSVRDLRVHADDLAIATHGRAFYILDDVTPLRALAANASRGARLVAPRPAVRTRPGDDQAEASPPGTPLGANPPNGAMLDYVVPPAARGVVTIEIRDAAGQRIRRYASDDVARAADPHAVPYPAYWIVTPGAPGNGAGMHRFVWDYRIGSSDGPYAAPGRYVVRATVAGRTFVQPLVLRRDPRVTASDADLVAQMRLAVAIDRRVAELRDALGSDAAALRRTHAAAALVSEMRLAQQLEDAVESADVKPTSDQTDAWRALDGASSRVLQISRASHRS